MVLGLLASDEKTFQIRGAKFPINQVGKMGVGEMALTRWMEGRQSLSLRSFQVTVIPFAFGVCNSHFKNLLGEIHNSES